METVIYDQLSGQTDDQEVILLRAVQVARLLGLSRAQIYAMMSDGTLPIIRIGRAVRVPKHALATWIRANTKRGAESDSQGNQP
jgi:excisionase family DNA binding protein